MAQIVKLDPGDVLVLAGMTNLEDPETLEAAQSAVDFLKREVGIAAVVMCEDNVRLEKIAPEDRARKVLKLLDLGLLDQEAATRLLSDSDDGGA